MRCRPRLVLSSALAVAVSLLAAGCGGGTGSPGVASVASSTPGAPTTTTQNGSESGQAQKSPGPSEGRGPNGPQFQIAMNVGTADGAKFAACMRKHGVPSFPDPNGQGVITIHSGMGIDPQSPSFSAARATCEKLLPNGGRPTPAQIEQQQQKLLAFSSCMRAHGIKDFPDPSNGGLRISVHPGSDLDPNNPTFKTAQQACQKYVPFKGASETAKSGGG